MIDTGSVNIGGRRTGGGGGAGGGGGVSQSWVDENYVSKEFFARLFTIHGHDAEDQNDPPTDIVVEPNDADTPIDSIEAMFGLWTEQFLTALGVGSGGSGGGGGASALYDLVDVIPNSYVEPSMVYGLTGDRDADDGKVLTFSKDNGGWIAATATGGSVTSITLEVPNGLLVNGLQSDTITGEGTFEITLATGYYLLSESQYDILDNLRYSTWWGQPVQNGVVVGAMSNVPSIDNLLFFDTETLSAYFSVGGGSKVYFSSNMMSQTILRMMNDGETDGTEAVVLKQNELVINNNPTSTSMKNLALLANDTMFFNTNDLERMRIDSAGNVGIGTTNPYTLLEVAGGIKAQKFYLYKPNAANDTGAIYFNVELSNDIPIGVHLYGGGLSADTYITALGIGSSSGGGGATSLTDLSDVNPNMNPQPGNVLIFQNGSWTAGSAGGVGTVTSITAGTGLATNTGQPITSYGTISIDSSTMTKINNGASMYDDRNSYLKSANVKTLTVKANSTDVLMYNPSSANASFNLKDGTGISITKSGYDISFKLTDIITQKWYTKVHVNAQGRVYEASNPTTLSGYGITDAVSAIVVGSGTNADKIGVKVNGSNGGWITVPFATKARQLETTRTLWGRNFNGTANVVGTLENVTHIQLQQLTANTGASLKFYYGGGSLSSNITESFSGNISINGQLNVRNGSNVGIGGPADTSANNYKLKVVGKIHATDGIDSETYITALSQSSSSDARMKNVIEDFVLTTDEIAEAPIVKFTWKAGDDNSVHVGSIAQYWRKVVPESVLDVNGKLSLEYGVLALLSAISLARTVVNHEQRLQRLEKGLSN